MYSETAQPVALPFAEQGAEIRLSHLIIFFAAHVFLALLMAKISAVATLHVLVTSVVGLCYALFDRRIERVAYVGAYMIGAEVLWRMTGAQTFWETGKYATMAIFVIATIRQGHFKVPALPTIYLVLLVPSTLMVLVALGWADARDGISFNLSGPMALTVSAAFFYNVTLSRRQLQRLFLALIAPALGIAGLALYGILTDPNIAYGFRGGSNFAASGGFGPNQVASILGLGALLLVFFLLEEGTNWRRRLLFWGCALWLASQCLLTFSRGGLYDLAVGVVVALPFLMRDPGTRFKLIVASVSLVIFCSYVLLPRLDSFTRGTLSTRFESVDTTGRANLLWADVELWQQHPLLGVGPGQAEFFRDSELGHVAAHTEFSRLLAEHGVLGFAALLLLLIAGIRRLVSAQSNTNKAVIAALVGWSVFNMLHAGMRVAAPSFAFALAYASLTDEEDLQLSFVVTNDTVRSVLPDQAQVQQAYEQFDRWLTVNRRRV